jgi:hypothetical protein
VGPRRRFAWKSGIFALVSLLFCAVALYQWRASRSYFTSLRVRNAVVMMADGKFCLLISTNLPSTAARPGLSSVPLARSAVMFQWPKRFSFSRTTYAGDTNVTAVAPLWFVAIVFALPAVYWILRGPTRSPGIIQH